MSTEFTTDRLIAAWLSGEAPTGAPDGLRDHIVSTTATIRPRPAWLARLKGNHMDVIVGGRDRQRLLPRRLVPVLLIVGLLLALVAGALLVGSRLRAPAPVMTRSSLPGPAFQVIAGDEGVYASSFEGNTTQIYRLDDQGAWVPIIDDLPRGHVTFVVGAGSIWASYDEGGKSMRWDARTGALQQELYIGAQPLEPVLAYDAVWHPIFRENLVVRVDVASGEATSIEIPAAGARDLQAGGGKIWVVDPEVNWLVGIDATTYGTVKTDSTLVQNCGLGYGGNRVWALPCEGGDVQVFDAATGASQGMFTAYGSVGEVFDHDGRVWVLAQPAGTDRNVIANVDPETRTVIREVDTGVTGGLTVLSFAEDAIWFGAGEEAVRIPLALLPES